MSRLLSRWLPVAAWMGLIFFMSSLSSLPTVAPPIWQELLSEGAHFTEYTILTGLLWRAWQQTSRLPWPYWLSFVIAALYAASDEFHQSFVPNRDASLGDFSIDVVGAIVALSLIMIWYGWHKRRSRGPG